MLKIRKRYRVPLLAVVVAAVAVPVGFALSIPSRSEERRQPLGPYAGMAATTAASVAASAPIILVADEAEWPSPFEDVPEGAKLFLLGTLLVGVSTVVRRAG